MRLIKLLGGRDLRSIGKAKSVVLEIKNQTDFDRLFKYLYHKDRIVVMRAADAIEKITRRYPSYLTKHKKDIIKLFQTAINKELKWHLAILASRLNLSDKETELIWQILIRWASDKEESRIVRVNSIQTLSEIAGKEMKLIKSFEQLIAELEVENIPSINARISKLKFRQFK